MSPVQLLSSPKHTKGPTYLFPYVCFGCRKTFRKPPSSKTALCPECAKPMVMLNRKFSSPKRKDAEQWRKVQLLVEHGFYFFSVYRTASNGKKIPVPYPERLADVAAFAREFNSQSALRSKGPSLKSPSASTSNSSDA